MVQKRTAELQGFHRSFKGQNPFELAFSLDLAQHRDSDFSPQCEARPDMPSSQPIDIPDAKKRGRKKKRCRATDSFSGRFEGELQRLALDHSMFWRLASPSVAIKNWKLMSEAMLAHLSLRLGLCL
uniref:Uncharacterized protein n=1 Tax=Mus spicilegus TaxID=10103 RepID=A0A8C6GVH2_MUSSI